MDLSQKLSESACRQLRMTLNINVYENTKLEMIVVDVLPFPPVSVGFRRFASENASKSMSARLTPRVAPVSTTMSLEPPPLPPFPIS